MEIIRLFCIVGKTGTGKSTYLNKILEDKEFLEAHNLSNLVYGTTRKKRNGEIDGVDYHFLSKYDYKQIPINSLIEFRSYYTLNDGTIYYFTKEDYLTNGNIICITSPYQYESYKNWIIKENLKSEITNKIYRLYLIDLNMDLKKRINRLVSRADSDDDVYERCRRIIQERQEDEDVKKRVYELNNPEFVGNVLCINNTEDDCLDENISRIKEYIHNTCIS